MIATETRELIAKIVDRITKDYGPRKIILFGSYASGNPTEDSDIDLFIIKNTDKRPIDRWVEVKKLLWDIEKDIPISPLVYTEEEVEERLKLKDFFVREILENGEVLYG
jgi:predicted nucleotidyltransferase